VARIVVVPAAVEDLERLILTHSLPADTKARFRRSVRPFGQFPLLGAALEGRWQGFRFVLGPWRWMVVVYTYDADGDVVSVVTIQDGRAARSPTSS
jgi:hypothetical protein